jgi:hypothetical protein
MARLSHQPMFDAYGCTAYLYPRSDGDYVCGRDEFGELSPVSNIGWLSGYSVDTKFAH